MAKPKLTRRKDGRYLAKYKGICFYGYTEKEALDLRNEYIRSEALGLKRSIGDQTFLEYACKWLPLYKRECGQRTYDDYRAMIARASGCFGSLPIKSISSLDVKAAFTSVEGLSASYIKKYCSLIRAILETACDDGVFLRNPARNVQPPKGKKGTHRALSKEEISMIVDAAARHKFGDAAMVMLFAGLRRGEMLALNIDRDVDFKEKTITVREAVAFQGNKPILSKGKNDFAARTIPLVPMLEKQLTGKHGLVLKGNTREHATETIVTQRFASFIRMMECEKNGVSQKRWYGKTKEHKAIIESGKKLPPWQEIDIRMHDFRHTFCVMLFDAGVDMKTAQYWMGHSDPTMIMKIYDHLSKEREKKASISFARLVDNFFGESKWESNGK